jgi:hypothetical protein
MQDAVIDHADLKSDYYHFEPHYGIGYSTQVGMIYQGNLSLVKPLMAGVDELRNLD